MVRRLVIASAVSAGLLGLLWWLLGSPPARPPATTDESVAAPETVSQPLGVGEAVTAESPAATDASATAEQPPAERADGVVEVKASEYDLAAGERVLAGQVLDPWDEPASGAEVVLVCVEWPRAIDDEDGARLQRLVDTRAGRVVFRDDVEAGLRQRVRLESDEHGRFVLRGVDAETYLIAARGTGTLLTPSRLLEPPAEGETDPPVTVHLMEALTVSGWVESDASETPAGTVSISAVLAESSEVWTDLRLGLDELTLHVLNPVSAEQPLTESGQFEFTGLGDLLYRVRVTAPPFAMAEVLTEATSTEPVVVVLEEGAVLGGQALDEDGHPVANVRVTLDLDRGGPVAASLRLGEWRPTTRTDSAGMFHLEGLPAGTYRLRARGDGFRRTQLEGLYLESGEEQFVEVRLGAGRVLSGQVFSAVDGEPLARARVRARPANSGRRWRWPHRTRSDDQGQFRLDTLTEGEIQLEVSHDEHVATRLEVEITELPAEPVEVFLEAGLDIRGRVIGPDDEPIAAARVGTWSRAHGWRGARAEEDGSFVISGLHAGEHHFSARASGFSQHREPVHTDTPDLGDIPLLPATLLEGVVLDPDGAPLPGVNVEARGVAPPGAPASERRRWRPRARGTLSDAEGGFRIELPDPEGWWQIEASMPRMRGLPVAPVETIGHDVTGLVLRFSWGGIIRGSVLDAGSAAPVTGAQVVARPTRQSGGGRRRGRRPASVRVQASGAYEITGLDPGEYTVQVRGPGYAAAVRGPVTVAEEERVELDLFLEPERVLVGQVVDARGAPLPGAQTVVERGARGRPRATTQGDGRFEIGGLGGGVLTVRVSAPEHVVWRGGEVLAGATPLLVALDPAVRVEGVVNDGDTGEPIAGARVRLAPRDAPRESGRLRAGWGNAVTEEDGRFVIDGVAAATHWLRVEARDYVTLAGEFLDLPLGEELAVELRRGGRIDGLVRDPRARGLGNVDVRVLRLTYDKKARRWRPVNSRPVARERSRGNGRFLVTGLPEGDYRVQLRHTNYQPMVVERVTVRRDGRTPQMRRTLRPGAELTGRVYGADGRGVEQGLARLRGDRGVDHWRVPVDREGRFRIRGIPAGAYRLDYLPARGQGERAGMTVEVRELERLRQDLHLGS